MQMARGGASGVRSKRWQTFFPAKRTNCEAMSITETQYAFVHCEPASTVCRNRTPTRAFTAALSSDTGLVSKNAKLMRRLTFRIHAQVAQILRIAKAGRRLEAELTPFENLVVDPANTGIVTTGGHRIFLIPHVHGMVHPTAVRSGVDNGTSATTCSMR